MRAPASFSRSADPGQRTQVSENNEGACWLRVQELASWQVLTKPVTYSVQRFWRRLKDSLTLSRISDAIAAKERSVLHQLRD